MCVGGAFPLYGNVSQVAVVHLTPAQASGELAGGRDIGEAMAGVVQQLMDPGTVQSTPGLYALITLAEGGSIGANKKGAIYRPPGSLGTGNPITGDYSFDPVMTVQFTAGSGGYNTGLPEDRVVTAEMIRESDAEGRVHGQAVKAAMKHAWNGYTKYAWGFDELKPLSHHGTNNWGGMGVTLVDSLDTLWIMGLKSEFNAARDWVRDHLSFDNAGSVSVFETTIRELGGLLAAYDLSGDKVFLTKAQDLGKRLFGAFNTPSGGL